MENKKKKILILTTAYFPFVGGAEIAVKEITDRLPGIEFSMITARMDKKLPKFERLGNIDVYRVGIGWPIIDKLWLAGFGYLLAQKLYKEKKFNIVWAIMASYAGFTASEFKNKNPDIKFLLTLQEGDDLGEIEKKVRLIKNKFNNIFKHADYIQAISNYLADWARTKKVKCPVEVVPNGTNQFSINNFQFSINEFKEKLGIQENEKTVMTASRLVKKNGVGDLIESMKDLPDNVKLLICGSGQDEEKLKNLSVKLGFINRVKFLGYIMPEELPKYYAVADVFCRPSITEGLGNVFLEAMSENIPVIATPVGGIPDFLADGQTGWFCEVRNPKSIAEKIKYILDENNKGEVQKVIANAREMVEGKYNWDKIASQINKIFVNLLG